MEINEQENTQELQQENLLDGSQSVQAMQEENELQIAVQLVQPQAALDEIATWMKLSKDLVQMFFQQFFIQSRSAKRLTVIVQLCYHRPSPL